MSGSMQTIARRYLRFRRKQGYALLFADGPLLDFARFADRVAPGRPLTTSLALQWAASRSANRPYRSRCLSRLRPLARFCAAFDPRTEVPPVGLLGPAYLRTQPHLFSAAEVRLILRRAKRMPPCGFSIRPLTYYTLIGLISCTGLRPCEALRLRRSDFDSRAGTLLVPPSKYSPTRLLPIHPSTVRALLRYQRARDHIFPKTEYLFVGRHGRPLSRTIIGQIFRRRLIPGITSNGARRRPRIYDLRHSFASAWIATCSRRSHPAPHRLVLLSRYLGHRHFHDTWWYVTSHEEALQSAARRFNRFQHGRHSLER